MFSKFNRLLAALFLSIFFVVSQGGYIWAVQACEVIEVDKGHPIFIKTLTTQEHEAYLNLIPKTLSLSNKKGMLGEIAAREAFESNIWGGKKYVSITTLFRNNNCSVDEYIRDNGGRGFDDIFVVRGADGWIDQAHQPIFHEAKYDGRCSLILKDTATLCQQLSFQWLDGNLKKTYKRTRRTDLCYGSTEVVIQSCLDCAERFQKDISWLKAKLERGNFIRTASLLCANGRLSIYKVNGS